MAVIKVKDHRSGITYVYENESYWDKEKHQARSHRKLIGKIDPATGEMIPTDGRGHHRRTKEQMAADAAGLTKAAQIAHYYYGATYLLDQIGKSTGVEEDLQNCFPDTYKEIRATLYFMILRNRDSIDRIDFFARMHKLPTDSITVDTCRKALSLITMDKQNQFCDLQVGRVSEKGFDSEAFTVIPSYRDALDQAKKEKGKGLDPCLQHISLRYGTENGLPVSLQIVDETSLGKNKQNDNASAEAVMAFDNIEDRLDIEAPRDSKYFMGYLSLIYLSYMEKQLRSSALAKDYTIQGILDELDLLECYEVKGLSMTLGKVTKKLREIYKAMGVKAPTAKG